MKQPATYTIESLQQRRNQLQKQLNNSKEVITDQWIKLFAPPQAETKVQMWVNQAERAYAIYDGVMLATNSSENSIYLRAFSIVRIKTRKNKSGRYIQYLRCSAFYMRCLIF